VTDDEYVLTVCRILGELDGFAWHEDGAPYDGSDGVAVFVGGLGTMPDRAVAVAFYHSDVDLHTAGLAEARVQVRFRGKPGDPLDADRIASQVFARLHGMSRSRGINHAQRKSVAQLGVDESRRRERADNYSLTPEG
jgi:hypothetical protein